MNVKKLTKPAWKSKRFWLGLILLAVSSIDLYSGAIRELLPGKEGAVVLMVIGGLNMMMQVRYSARFRQALMNGDLTVKESEEGEK